MKKYTLICKNPSGDIAPRIKDVMRSNGAEGQFVIWDGPAKLRDVRALYEMIRPYCAAGILSYYGSGKAIASYGKW
jgi:hypothetical protein